MLLGVTQGKITIGLDLHLDNEEQKYDAMLYNAILGGTANSKMFQDTIVYEFTEKGVTASQGDVQAVNEWDEFMKVIETRKSVILYVTRLSMNIH